MTLISHLQRQWARERARLRTVNERNIRIFKQQPWTEIAGGFGDIGTFIPIFIALVGDYNSVAGDPISAASTLVFSGLFNVLTGLYFGIPLPVQPMKAIAATAIASREEWNQARYASAGLFVAAAVAFLSVTGLLGWFTRNVPVPIVKGIQVGAGLSLIASGCTKLFVGKVDWIHGHLWTSHSPSEIVWLAVTLLFLLFCSTRPRSPFFVVLVGISIVGPLVGMAITGATCLNPSGDCPRLSIWEPETLVPDAGSFVFGAFNAGLGQLPLTTLNSIVAVVYLAEDLLPDAPAPSATAVGLSVASMNLIGCWFKAMPVCHGSGGLAAQYRFGARSGASIIFLGLLKVVLGLFASQFVYAWCTAWPNFLLFILLLLAGTELIKMGENLNGEGARDLWKVDQEVAEETPDAPGAGTKIFTSPDATQRMRRYMTMLVTVGMILGTKNDGVGFLAGLIVHYAYKFQDWEEAWRARREGQVRLD